jgi:protein phosphatase 1 regulatory subunit 7
VDLTANKIKVLPQIASQSLFKLVLDENEIETSELKTNQGLRILSMNKNKMVNLNGFTRFFNLEEFSIQENEITTLEGLSSLPKLKKLMLNGNKLEKLDHLPVLECIEEIFLDGNQIASLAEISKLSILKSLTHISMVGNPIAEEKGDEFKKEVLILLNDLLPNLKKINGEFFTQEELTDAMTLRDDRIKEAEVAEAEAAAAAAAKPEGEEEAPAEE